MKRLLTILATGLCVGMFSFSANAAKFLTIGTGGVTGVYYPSGGAIAKMVNAKRKEYGIRATVESTGGSVMNVNAILAGDLELGIVQSDRGYQAWNGLAEWEKIGPQKSLRSVFSLHPELVNLIVAVDSGVKDCKSMKGKRIAVGNPGSGTRQNAEDALQTCGLTFDDIQKEDFKASEGASMLKDGRIDGYFYTVGHPNGSIKEAIAGKRDLAFVGFDRNDKIKALPYYVAADVPLDSYPGIMNETPVTTFGVKATLMSSSEVSEDAIYAVTKEVFENFETFKKLHPAFAHLTKESMLEGLTAPFHAGAARYYKEAGLLK